MNIIFNRPEDIASEIYPQINQIDEETSNSNIENNLNFDKTLGNIVNIIVSYDMGWSRRGSGRSYDSLNGYGAIIGFLSGKFLDFRTRNRKCRLCDKGHNPNDHDCRKNHQGSSKSMEAAVGAELVNNSKILQDAGVSVRVLIADEDSSTIASVREGSEKRIFKLADNNHLKKHVQDDLHDIKPKFKELRKAGVITHILKCFTYAVARHKGKASELAIEIKNIPDHLFDKHDNCTDHCYTVSGVKESQTFILKDQELYKELCTIFSKYAQNAHKFSVAASSQANESLNGVMAHKSPKNICYSTSQSCDYRLAEAVLCKNEGSQHLLEVKKILNTSSASKHLTSYACKQDNKKRRKSAFSKLPYKKARRNKLKEIRDNERRATETREGVTYRGNCGMELDNGDCINIDSVQEVSSNSFDLIKTCEVIYFDIETSSLARNCDILQIAARKDDNLEFHCYINPKQNISVEATKINHLENRHGELFLNEEKVLSIPMSQALNCFFDFLESFQKPCLLVAHNAKFDVTRILKAIKDYSLTSKFQNVIYGFSDTLKIFKIIKKNRKGPGMFKLKTLAEDECGIKDNANFHEALYDVRILQKVTNSIVQSLEQLFTHADTYVDALNSEFKAQIIRVRISKLSQLQTVISVDMIKKIAICGITYADLITKYKDGGKESVVQLLTENINNKPRVTKSKRILDCITNHLLIAYTSGSEK